MHIRQPGSKALVIYNGKLVLVQRDNKPDILNPNKWNLPGGGIEDDESPRDALIRELREEINIEPLKIEEMGTTTYADGGSVVYRFAARLTLTEYHRVRL
ncbi:MAG: NUDIX domain-containing protein, partial [Candidatus Uhrbacteria bacterium]|nr:NUDIX domain-containing protein [Candidatus Uhrbacteria bacterium]